MTMWSGHCHSSGQERHTLLNSTQWPKAASTKISTNKPRSQNCRFRTVPFSYERMVELKTPSASAPPLAVTNGGTPSQSRACSDATTLRSAADCSRHDIYAGCAEFCDVRLQTSFNSAAAKFHASAQ